MAADGKHPKFTRQNRAIKKRVRAPWRKPRGIDNKQRVKKKWAGAMPSIGYRKKKSLRNIHACGKPEKLVHNDKELRKLEGKNTAARIASNVGKRKKTQLLKTAFEIKVKVLNPRK
ncbi:MAG: eL32 family ribosomal protein [Candidatus Micrarchaeia archaeon]